LTLTLIDVDIMFLFDNVNRNSGRATQCF